MAKDIKQKVPATKKATNASSKKSRTRSAAAPNKGAKTAVKPGFFAKIKGRIQAFLKRRPHRSFKRTHRRDYKRSLKLPGYWAFTFSVFGVLKRYKYTFLLLGIIYAVLSVTLLGFASQEQLTEVKDSAVELGQQVYEGNWSQAGTAVIVTLSSLSGNLTPQLTEVQQVYAVILGLFVWLTVVWFLRQSMAKHAVKLRDALYSAGAPIIPMFLLFFVLLLQLLPIALVMIGYSAAQASGLLAGGVEAMLFWAAAVGLIALSLYWVTSTAMALIIVTLPGMYPFKALSIAGDMVVGRRLRILYRLLWMFLIGFLGWVIVIFPIALIDTGIKSLWPAIEWLPVVPVVIVCLTTASVIWASAYIYLLYRRIVDDDAKPA